MIEEIDIDGVEQVAVVGMAGRFPAAPNIEAFWENLQKGADCLHTFSDAELEDLGVLDAVRGHENFVPRGSILEGYDRFDAERFGFRPREAAMTDPQARVFLETAHEALEHAGYDPFNAPGEVGVFAGCNPIDYALLLGRPDPTDSLSGFDQMIGNDRDFLATRVSHRLGLTGPALNVQTACSTSLVAIHLAAQHLLEHQCSMALAGGVSLNFRQGIGYFAQQGMILSPTGACRAFDQRADGTTLGQASAAVVLKRLSDAVADGDTIHAVLAASAINNDGSDKISYTAPSVEGQAEVIATAHALADVTGDDITYIEAHGTGTHLGDPVEVSALTKAFRLTTDGVGHCAIGSVKTNVGHTDAAAGVTGFIKAVLCVREGVIPQSLGFDEPNEAIDFSTSPFFVPTERIDWDPKNTDLRRAGVSSFGIGGTNAHVIVAEPPPKAEPPNSLIDDTRPRVAAVSAPAATGANDAMAAVEVWSGSIPLDSDHLNTLVVGRTHHEHRRIVTLHRGQLGRSVGAEAQATGAVWMFSGQGAQFAGMARGAEELPEFRAAIEQVSALIVEAGGPDVGPLVMAERDDQDATERLRQTHITQPALFAVQYAAAQQLEAWGIRPEAVVGHSIGEFAAAVVAGVLTVADAAHAVVERGRLMQAMEPGAMVALRLDRAEVEQLLIDGVELAAHNSSAATVVAGSFAAIEQFEASLSAQGIDATRLATSHAFHTTSMAAAAEDFAVRMATTTLSIPRIPMLSNVTGEWMTDAEAIDPARWGDQIRRPVRFADCLQTLAAGLDEVSGAPAPAGKRPLLLEVGPGTALSSFVTGHSAFDAPPQMVTAIGGHRGSTDVAVRLVEAAGLAWANGIAADLSAVNGCTGDEQRVPAPRSVLGTSVHWAPKARHVLALTGDEAGTPTNNDAANVRKPVDEWAYERSFRRWPSPPAAEVGRVLLLTNDGKRARCITEQLRETVADVIEVSLGEVTDLSGPTWTLAPADDDGFRQVMDRLVGTSRRPDRIVHLWLADEVSVADDVDTLRRRLNLGVDSLLSMARAAAGPSKDRPIHIVTIAAGAHDVVGSETVIPSAAGLAGPVKVIPLEYSGITCRLVDVCVDGHGEGDASAVVREILATPDDHPVVAIRNGRRWVHDVAPAVMSPSTSLIEPGGSYLLIGGTGGVGLSLAHHLAEQYGANLTLTSRSGDPRQFANLDDETQRRAARLDEIEQAAPSLRLVKADVTDLDDMRRVIADAEEAHGALQGVIVAAAVADTEGAIHRRSAEAAEAAIAAKVHGTIVLSEALRGRKLDFVMLSSSIASQLFHNRFGQVGYVTANSFVEAAAESTLFSADRVVTVAWDDWTDVGMSVRAAGEFARRHGSDIQLVDEVHSFSPSDGVALFERVLGSDAPTLFVSTTDLGVRLVEDRTATSPFLDRALSDETTADDVGDVAAVDGLVLEAWQSLLGIDELDSDDDFFDLGGDSLQVARMADRLGRRLGVDVALDLIFDNPTLGGMTEAISSVASGGGEAAPAVEYLDEVLGEHELTPAQQRFFERGSVNPHHFNVSVLLEAQTSLEFGQIERLVASAARNHDAFRTLFRLDGDRPTRTVFAECDRSVVIEHFDLRDRGSGAMAVAEAAMAERQAGLDLEVGPTTRVVLFDMPGAEQRLFFTMHHLLTDRLSLLALLDEFDDAIDKNEFEITQVPVPFSAWAAEMAAYPSTERAETDRAAWAQHAGVASPGQLPGNPAPAKNAAVNVRKIALDQAVSKQLLRHDSGRVDELVLLGLSDALRCWADEERPIGIDVLGHGRRVLDGLDVSRTFGFFLSYSPVWLQAVGADEIAAGVQDLRVRLERAWTFDPLRSAGMGPGLDRKHPDVLFNFVGRPISTGKARHLMVSDEPRGSDTDPANSRGHAVAVMAEITADDVVVLTIVADSDRFDQTQIDDLERTLEQRLVAIGGA